MTLRLPLCALPGDLNSLNAKERPHVAVEPIKIATIRGIMTIGGSPELRLITKG